MYGEGKLRKIAKLICKRMPCWSLKVVIMVLLALGVKKKNKLFVENLEKYYEVRKVKSFAKKIMQNFQGECDKIKKKGRYVVIDEGKIPYGICNACYLNHVISIILAAMSYGCIPIIKENTDKEYFTWTTFFIQPAETLFGKFDLEGYEEVEWNRYEFCYSTSFDMLYKQDEFDFCFFNFFYKKVIVLNDMTASYVNDELRMIKNKNVLGVLVRGTDYITLKPAGHPKQPPIEDIVAKVKEKISEKPWDAIYVATEEERYMNIMRKAFDNIDILENKRRYYDKYYSENKKYINEVTFDRENDSVQKGLQYFSSMMILSQCDGIVAGNCGGARLAMLMSKPNVDSYVFDLGYY